MEGLGKPLLAYALGATEDEVEAWLVTDVEQFGTERQTHALQQLLLVLRTMPNEEHPMVRHLNLSRFLGLYQERFNTTLINAVRMIATADSPGPVPDATATLEAFLEKMTRDAYPLFLLPNDHEFHEPFPS